jgi:hypothetical protein
MTEKYIRDIQGFPKRILFKDITPLLIDLMENACKY